MMIRLFSQLFLTLMFLRHILISSLKEYAMDSLTTKETLLVNRTLLDFRDLPRVVIEESVDSTEGVHHPSHYNQINGVECIEVIEQMPFNTGNAMKYLWRYMDKGEPITDLRKAKWYIDREISRLKDASLGDSLEF
jgi:hypothetical protein